MPTRYLDNASTPCNAIAIFLLLVSLETSLPGFQRQSHGRTWGVMDGDNPSHIDLQQPIGGLSMCPLPQVQLPWQHL